MTGTSALVRAVVVGIVKRDGKVLIAERPPGKPYSGYWEFPGGKIENQESGEVALQRELFEELNIKVESARLLFSYEHAYPEKTVFLEMWLVEQFQGEPTSMEQQTLQWATWDEVVKLKLLSGVWPVLDKLKDLVG